MADLNGSADPFAQYVADLHAQLAREDAEAEAVRAHLLAIQDRQRRLNKAIDALSHETPKMGRPPTKAKAPGKKTVWRPSPENTAKVLDALTQGPGTIADLAERSGTSRHIVRNAVESLRGDEKVRLAGKRHSRGARDRRGIKATVYALMPGDSDGA